MFFRRAPNLASRSSEAAFLGDVITNVELWRKVDCAIGGRALQQIRECERLPPERRAL